MAFNLINSCWLINSPWRPLLAFILRALICSLCINACSLLEYFGNDSHSPYTFSDWDEGVYLARTLDFGQLTLQEFLNGKMNGEPITSRYLVNFPQSLVDFTLGKAAHIVGLGATQLGLLLDVICAFICYFIFTHLFSQLSSERQYGETAAVVSLVMPALGILGNYIHLPISFGQNILPASAPQYPCTGVLRGVYTQISLIVFGLTINALLQALGDKKNSNSKIQISGIFVGLCLYIYFFSYVAAIALGSVFLVASSLLRTKGLRPSLSILFPFLTYALVFSLPGLLIIFSGLSGTHLSLDANLRYFWNLPLEHLLLLICLSFLLYRQSHKLSTHTQHAILLIASCLITELILLNIQPFIGRVLTPYHFSLFFFNPLITGTLIILAISAFRSSKLQLIASRALYVVTLTVALNPSCLTSPPNQDLAEFIELVNAIDNALPLDATLSMVHISNPYKVNWRDGTATRVLPFSLRAISRRKMFPIEYETGEDKVRFERQLAAGWLFSGKAQSFIACPDSYPNLPGDISMGYVTWIHYHETKTCQQYARMIDDFTPCEQLDQNRVDYLIWESEFGLEKPHWFSVAARLMWTSSRGKFELYQIDRLTLRDEFCSYSADSR